MADLLDFIGFKMFSAGRNNSSSVYLLPFTLVSVCLLASFGVNAQEASAEAQGEVIPTNLAAPAVKIISKEEKSALAGTGNVKDRTKVALELMVPG